MNINEFKFLWQWCNEVRSNDEFWRRFVIATAVYDTKTQARLIRFANEVWFDGGVKYDTA